MHHFVKRAQITTFTTFANNNEVVKIGKQKTMYQQLQSQFLAYLNKIELEKVSKIIGRNILTSYISPTNKKFLPLKIALNNILSLSRRELAEA